jgi:hypothetical protein
VTAKRYVPPGRLALAYAKPPFAGPAQVLGYVGRYTHRIVISNSRLLAIDEDGVRFRWKDYRRDNRHGTMTLTGDEFIRRFLIHVLPSRLQRIRYYGFLCNRQRTCKLARCRELIGAQCVQREAGRPRHADRTTICCPTTSKKQPAVGTFGVNRVDAATSTEIGQRSPLAKSYAPNHRAMKIAGRTIQYP